MPSDPNKIDLALKEIEHCDCLTTKIKDGVIVCIPKQRHTISNRHGVKKELIIDEEITR